MPGGSGSSHEPRDLHTSLFRSLAEELCRKMSHSPSPGALEMAGAPSPAWVLPEAPAPLQGCLRLLQPLPGSHGRCPAKRTPKPVKKQQHPPGTQRPSSHRYIVLPSFNCRYTGAVRWRLHGQEMQQDAKPLEKAFRSLWKPNYSSVSHGC